jgi:hypothetical protein
MTRITIQRTPESGPENVGYLGDVTEFEAGGTRYIDFVMLQRTAMDKAAAESLIGRTIHEIVYERPLSNYRSKYGPARIYWVETGKRVGIKVFANEVRRP